MVGIETLEDGRLGQQGTILEDLEPIFKVETLNSSIGKTLNALDSVEVESERTDLDFGMIGLFLVTLSLKDLDVFIVSLFLLKLG